MNIFKSINTIFSFILILLLPLLLFSTQLNATSKHYYYKHIGLKEGLSQLRIQSIMSDHKGYLWVGTKWGLNRYDGENVYQYFHNDKDKSSISSNDIVFIVEDSVDNLWVGTTIGLCLYDRNSDTFEQITRDDRSLFVSSFLLIEDGILFAGPGTLYKYDYEAKELSTLYQATSSSGYITFQQMVKIDDENVLLNTRWHGVYLYNLESGVINKADFLSGKNYSKIFVDSENSLWVSEYGEGLIRYKNNSITDIFTPDNSNLSYSVILDIIQKDDNLWIATDGGGLNILSLRDLNITNIQHNRDNVSSFPNNNINRLYKDLSNNIWAGTVQSGLIGIREVFADSYINVPFGNKYGLSNQTTNCLLEDSDGAIWIGTDGGGINKFIPNSSSFIHFRSVHDEKVVSIVDFSSTELLYFSFNRGFFTFNKSTEKVNPFIVVNDSINNYISFSGFSAYAANIDSNKMLFSTAYNIITFDKSKNVFKIVASRDEDFERNSPGIITTIDSITYLTDLTSILAYDHINDNIYKVVEVNHVINSATIDDDNNIWIATTEGLLCYNIMLQAMELIDTKLFKDIVSIVVDNKNRLWIGSHNNLFVYKLDDKKFSIMSQIDGIISNEYISKASIFTKGNDIIMGGTNGMSIINSDIDFTTSNNYHVEVLDFLINGSSSPILVDSDHKIATVKIPWNFSSFKLKVILNNRDVLQENLFQFKINEVQQDNLQSSPNTLTLNYLPIGDHLITSSYLDKNGDWSEHQTILKVKVIPPWWKTIWALLLYSLLLITILISISYWTNKRRETLQLHKTIDLNNRVYDDKIRFLTNISHELRTPLTLIIAPLKRIIDRKDVSYNSSIELSSVYKQATKMKEIIDMVLDVRKLEEGNATLNIAPYLINEWVQKIGSEFIYEFKTKNIHLKYQLDENLKYVYFDSLKCRFVLSNLLMNAYKFSTQNTLVLISTSLSDDENWVRISVKDQGVGLKNVDIDSLFTDFYQAENIRGGTGIGLSYAKSIVLNHSGKIGVVDNDNEGATFYYDLPINSKSNIQITQPDNSNSVSEEKSSIDISKMEETDYRNLLKSYSIVIAEDSVELRNFLKTSIEDYFSKIYISGNGKDALEAINKYQPDLVISDVVMPIMNGYELCKEVKTNINISHIPVILLTSYHNPQNMSIGYKMGADAFLPKPFDIDTLLYIVHNQLKLRNDIKTRYTENDNLSLQEITFSNADETFLINLNNLLDKNISNTDIDVTFIASNMFISRSLLFDKVKSLTGIGINEYLNKKRIEKATYYLISTSYNVSEISELVGFSSPRYFSKVFKDFKGVTPSQFKKESPTGEA